MDAHVQDWLQVSEPCTVTRRPSHDQDGSVSLGVSNEGSYRRIFKTLRNWSRKYPGKLNNFSLCKKYLLEPGCPFTAREIALYPETVTTCKLVREPRSLTFTAASSELRNLGEEAKSSCVGSQSFIGLMKSYRAGGAEGKSVAYSVLIEAKSSMSRTYRWTSTASLICRPISCACAVTKINYTLSPHVLCNHLIYIYIWYTYHIVTSILQSPKHVRGSHTVPDR